MKFVKLISAGVVASLAVTAQFGVTSAEQGKHEKHEENRSVGQLTFIGEQRISNDTTVKGTIVGGLSGIDYDAKTHKWIMISDDRSDKSPARFYTANLKYDTNGFSSVTITGMNEFKQPNGALYPNKTAYTANHIGIIPDLESIRFDPNNNSVWYTSEGDRSLAMNPFINQADLHGKYMSSFQIPAYFKVDPSRLELQQGFRNNLALEGSTFSPDGKYYYTSMEGSLYQDGDVSTVNSGSNSRITKYDRNGNIVAQYAYPVSAIYKQPGLGKNADNGVTELLAVNDHKFLIMERSGVQASDESYSYYIRIYEVDTDKATNIKDYNSLKIGQFKPVSKRLVLDLNSLGLPKQDNIEGIAWGPKLKNGHDSLVLVSDNNFNPSQVTQFLAFDVSPETKKNSH